MPLEPVDLFTKLDAELHLRIVGCYIPADGIVPILEQPTVVRVTAGCRCLRNVTWRLVKRWELRKGDGDRHLVSKPDQPSDLLVPTLAPGLMSNTALFAITAGTCMGQFQLHRLLAALSCNAARYLSRARCHSCNS